MYNLKHITNMNKMDKIVSDLRLGLTTKEVATKYELALSSVKPIRAKYVGVTSNVVKMLNDNPDFKEFFIELHSNESLLIKDMVEYIQKHPLFSRKIVNQQRISEIRKFYNLSPRMEENVYDNDYDRIRGYIIRNSKYTSKRRNIEFNLKYTDFEIPEYCPILNIKLTYLTESNGNDPSHASLDRIDNTKGYIKGNVIVISRLANAMKNQASFNQLELFSKNILKLVNYYKNQGALGSITDVFDDFSPKLSLDS